MRAFAVKAHLITAYNSSIAMGRWVINGPTSFAQTLMCHDRQDSEYVRP
jgi:hypothetical protein